MAARALKKGASARILARNYRCPMGEADLIALIDETIVFVEVKRRSGDDFVDPAAAIDARKRRQYRKVARYYLQKTRRDDLAGRFDVVIVVMRDGRKPEIRHIPDAFQ